MQQHFKIFAIVALLSLAGCKKFLEQLPDNRAQLNSPEQVSRLLATAYPSGNYMQFTELSTDNAADRGQGDQGNDLVDPFTFTDVRSEEQDSPNDYWNDCYRAIAAANQALEVCVNADNPGAYYAQKGEALLCRAYAHFMLVTFYAELYDPATAGSAPGVPYVTEPEKEVIKQYDRKTVAHVYQMIEKDLLEGLPLINERAYSVPRFHFNKAAANAFAARFFLFKRDYAKVVQYANQVLSDGSITDKMRPWNTRYLTYTSRELAANYAKSTESTNLLLCETASWWARNYRTSRYGMTVGIQRQIFTWNVTGGPWAFQNQTYYVNVHNYFIPKIDEYFVRQSVNAEIGVGYVMVPLFTVEEVLFNRAEANTYLNNTTAALQDLNTYASVRIDSYDPVRHAVTSPKIAAYYGLPTLRDGLIQTILDFKRAEFVQEGMRWFDILRYRIPVTHVTDGKTYTLTANDPRRLFQIPQTAGESGVPQNPR